MFNFLKQRGSDLYDNYILTIYFNHIGELILYRLQFILQDIFYIFIFDFLFVLFFVLVQIVYFCSHILIFFPAYNTVAQQRATDGTMIDGDNSQVPLKR